MVGDDVVAGRRGGDQVRSEGVRRNGVAQGEVEEAKLEQRVGTKSMHL